MRLHDISPVVSADIDVWPGDVPFASEKSVQIAAGGNLDLGSMRTTFHVGAHADAPSHYVADGKDIAEVPLTHYYGKCQVLHVDIGRGQRIEPMDIVEELRAPKVLLQTGTFPDPNAWNEDFAALSKELVDHLAERHVHLVGIDTPSVDLFDDKELEAHKALARHGMNNLEGLALQGVRPGTYTLAAFPLRIKGADASPVRAVLIQD